jgi:hypothetical protein
MKSITDNAYPNRLTPNTANDDPNRANDRNDKELPNGTCSANETAADLCSRSPNNDTLDPKRANDLTARLLPIFK